jgi:hypothetical protein
VDDLLPISREGTLMCTFSTNKGELWASIIEKAVRFIYFLLYDLLVLSFF